MSKTLAFVGLVGLVIVFAILAGRADATFLSDLWTQLFWLALGTLATSFVLDALLQRAAHVRQRARDAFAFRSFAASMLDALSGIVDLQPRDEAVFETALSGDKPFAAEAARAASRIEQSAGFDPAAYLRHYLDVASGLRDMSRSYIRLFSANGKEMLARYRELSELANRWQYKDEFAQGSREFTASLPAGGAERVARETAFDAQRALARALAAATARLVSTLAEKTATGKGFYD